MILTPPREWDIQTDVVIVGSGAAGFAAAVGALESNARVVILEKGEQVGGTTRRSYCAIWAPNCKISLAAGIRRSREDLVTYLNAIGGGQQDPELINKYIEQAPVWIDHLDEVTNGKLKLHCYSTHGSYYDKPGAVKDEGSIVPDGNGAGFIEVLKEWAEGRGATVMVGTPVTHLFRNENGRIVGVKAGYNGTNIEAKRGVILAAGGFDWNKEMMLHYMRGPIDFSGAPKTNTGDGVLMAMAAGADMRNMNNCWGQPHYLPPIGEGEPAIERGEFPGAIVVNRFGKRFVNESTSYPSFNRAFDVWDTVTQSYPNYPAYTITDSEHRKRYVFAGVSPRPDAPEWVSKANTLSELALKLNIDPEGLEKTVKEFNKYAREGIDPYFHRGEGNFDRTIAGDWSRKELKNGCVAPLTTPPFYGVELHPAVIGTCGGPRINSDGQVLDYYEEPIPGLYAAGNNAASPFGAGYPAGGGTVGPATTFGWLAGKHASKSVQQTA